MPTPNPANDTLATPESTTPVFGALEGVHHPLIMDTREPDESADGEGDDDGDSAVVLSPRGMTAGTETGSLVNHLLSALRNAPSPTVGMGCTILQWTDRQAGTIIAVSPDGRRVTVQWDQATRTDFGGMSEQQEYSYLPDPTAPTRRFRLGRRGWRESGTRGRGNGLLIGQRQHYRDYSF